MRHVVNDSDYCLNATIVSLAAKLAVHEATIAAQKIIIGNHEACAAALRPHLKQMDQMLAAAVSESEPANVPNAPSPIAAAAPGHQEQTLLDKSTERSTPPSEPNENTPDWRPATESEHDDSLPFVVLECGAPMRVYRASSAFLRLFGFRQVETKGRSLRICFGPGTDTGVIDGQLRHVAAGGLNNSGIWSKVVLYKNSGEEISCCIQAELEPADEGEDEPMKARLVFRAMQPRSGLPTPPIVTISADEPYAVLDSNQAFQDLYQMPVVAMLQSRGMSLVWGPGTDVRLWRSLVEQVVASGGSKTCSLSTYTSSGEEVVVDVTMQPTILSTSDNTRRPRQLQASLVPRIPDDDTSDSADAVCNNPSNALCVAVNKYDEGIWPTTGSSEQSDSVSRCVVSGNCVSSECLPINSQDVALRIHLKAMRAHVLKKASQGTS